MKNSKLMILSSMALFAVMFSSCDKDVTPEPVDTSFYATKLGGEVKVADPLNAGQTVEQGFLNLRTVVINTVTTIATNEGGKYEILQPYFSVLLAEVGAGQTTGLNMLVMDFSEFLAEATGAKNFKYSGLSMSAAHDPAKNPRMTGKIDNEDFDLFVQAVVEGAAQAGITSNDVIGPVGELLESVRAPIVQD